MLIIRFIRRGKKNQPFFRIVITDKRNAPKGGGFLEVLGFFNPLTKEKSLKKERIKYWLSVGAKTSDRVRNLLISEKVIQGKKVDVFKKPKKKKEEKKVQVKKEEKVEEKIEKEEPKTETKIKEEVGEEPKEEVKEIKEEIKPEEKIEEKKEVKPEKIDKKSKAKKEEKKEEKLEEEKPKQETK